MGLKVFAMAHHTREAWPAVFRIQTEHLDRMAMLLGDAPR